VQAARAVEEPRRTPLLAGTPLDELTGGRTLKLERSSHRFNKIAARTTASYSSTTPSGKRRSRISSGNHARVAAAARLLGIRATIVMPADAPRAKLENTRALGAEVVLYDRVRESREQIAGKLALDQGATLVPAFDDPHVIAGQGTTGLELMQQAGELGLSPDQVRSGAAAADSSADRRLRSARLPEGRRTASSPRHSTTHAARAAGVLLGIRRRPGCSLRRLQPSPPGKPPSRSTRELLAGILTVSDVDVEVAMARAFRHLRLVIEPGGAVALAAALAGKLPLRERTTAIVVSGGNVDVERFVAALAR
jgi:threonine dehydratase